MTFLLYCLPSNYGILSKLAGAGYPETTMNDIEKLKRWTPVVVESDLEEQLGRALGIAPVFCRMLVQRGIHSVDEARRFFHPELEQLHSPFAMRDMDRAVARLEQAIQHEERILLYGDYDVDGATAVAMFYCFLERYHRKLDYYFPDREKEGYGLSRAGIEYAAQTGVGMIIALDCGTQAFEAVELARARGIDIIICDHHLPKAALPRAAALLNPKRFDCEYPFKELSGCGVGFKLAQAFVERQGWESDGLRSLLDFVVISIAGDIVPIVGENRVLAYFGIQQLNATQRPGLLALIEQSGKKYPLTIGDIVFGLAPLINAAGRLADAEQAVRLMLAKDRKVAAEYARALSRHNQMRQMFDRDLAKEAEDLLKANLRLSQQKSIVLYEPHWHQGVVGIAASRLAEAYHRPTVVLTQCERDLVGSARSVKNFNIHRAMQACDDLLTHYGGHHHAVGLSLREENLEPFRERFEAAVRAMITEQHLQPEIEYLAEIGLEQITPKFWRVLRQFAPFGPGNPEPIFLSRGVSSNGYARKLNEHHLQIGMWQNGASFAGVAFGWAAEQARFTKRQIFDVCYALLDNKAHGKNNLRLNIKDIRFPD
jgi:single-stranded-DNA-specific exonuclease